MVIVMLLGSHFLGLLIFFGVILALKPFELFAKLD